MNQLKTIFIFILLLLISSSTTFCQTKSATIYIDSLPQPVIFYGYDFSNLKLVDTTRTAAEMNGFIAKISRFHKDRLKPEEFKNYFDDGRILSNSNLMSEINYYIIDSNILAFVKPSYHQDSLQHFANNYKISDSTGTGFIVIFECFERESKTITAHLIIFNIKTRKIEWALQKEYTEKRKRKNLDTWKYASYITSVKLFEQLHFRVTPPEVTGKFFIGPLIGTGSSNIRGSSGVIVRPHIHAGITAEYRINSKIHVQPLLMVSSKGLSSAVINPEKSIPLWYCDLIVNFKYPLRRYLYIGAGLQAGYLIKSNYRYHSHGTDYITEFDIDRYTNDFDFGLNSCIGWRFANGVGLEVSYLYGLREIFNNKSNEPIDKFYGPAHPIPDDDKGKNSVLSVTFYHLFGRNKLTKK